MDTAPSEPHVHDVRWCALGDGRQAPLVVLDVSGNTVIAAPFDRGEGGSTAVTRSSDRIQVSANDVGGLVRLPELLVKSSDDMVTMADASRAAVLHNLERRFESDVLYTAVGDVLISLNPFRWIRSVFDESTRQLYADADTAIQAAEAGDDIDANGADEATRAQSPRSLPPHLWRVAHEARRLVRERGPPPAILISGESGAGKTEAMKKVLAFFTADSDKGVGSAKDSVSTAAVHGNLVLEAFGNAQTVRNDNSSRFGKWMQVDFEHVFPEVESSGIDGSGGSGTREASNIGRRANNFGRDTRHAQLRLKRVCTSTFLLETARVVAHARFERNFHFLHTLVDACAGADDKEDQHSALLHELRLPPPAQVRYLQPANGTPTGDKDGEHAVAPATAVTAPQEQLRDALEAMKCAGLPAAERGNLCRVVGAILHLGNIEFVDTEDDTGTCSTVLERDIADGPLACAARLLNLDAATLEQSLTTKVAAAGTGVRSEQVLTRLTASAAASTRSALAKALYSAMFSRLVLKLNTAAGASVAPPPAASPEPFSPGPRHWQTSADSPRPQHTDNMRADGESVPTMGVLDIFGFEVFDSNSFEQLCINYCNEALQQVFNQRLFVEEEEMCKSEGVPFDGLRGTSAHRDGAEMLLLLGGPALNFGRSVESDAQSSDRSGSRMSVSVGVGNVPRVSLLDLLDEEVIMSERAGASAKGVGSPSSFIAKMQSNLGAQRRLGYDAKNSARRGRVSGRDSYAQGSDALGHEFWVTHFAGRVVYDATLMVQKNRDPLHASALAVLESSTNSYVRILASVARGTEHNSGGIGGKRKRTVGSKFRAQLVGLLGRLREMELRFVRCIKPNRLHLPRRFDGHAVAEQLRSAAVVETVRVYRHGHPYRVNHAAFLERYSAALLPRSDSADAPTLDAAATAAAQCRRLLTSLGLLAAHTPQTATGTSSSDAASVPGALVGRTRILFRAEQHEQLENARRVRRAEAAVSRDRMIRGFVCRRRARRWRACRQQLVAAIATRDEVALRSALHVARVSGAIWLVQVRMARAALARSVAGRRILTALLQALKVALVATSMDTLLGPGEIGSGTDTDSSIDEDEIADTHGASDADNGDAQDDANDMCLLSIHRFLRQAERNGLQRMPVVVTAQRLCLALQPWADARDTLIAALQEAAAGDDGGDGLEPIEIREEDGRKGTPRLQRALEAVEERQRKTFRAVISLPDSPKAGTGELLEIAGKGYCAEEVLEARAVLAARAREAAALERVRRALAAGSEPGGAAATAATGAPIEHMTAEVKASADELEAAVAAAVAVDVTTAGGKVLLRTATGVLSMRRALARGAWSEVGDALRVLGQGDEELAYESGDDSCSGVHSLPIAAIARDEIVLVQRAADRQLLVPQLLAAMSNGGGNDGNAAIETGALQAALAKARELSVMPRVPVRAPPAPPRPGAVEREVSPRRSRESSPRTSPHMQTRSHSHALARRSSSSFAMQAQPATVRLALEARLLLSLRRARIAHRAARQTLMQQEGASATKTVASVTLDDLDRAVQNLRSAQPLRCAPAAEECRNAERVAARWRAEHTLTQVLSNSASGLGAIQGRASCLDTNDAASGIKALATAVDQATDADTVSIMAAAAVGSSDANADAEKVPERLVWRASRLLLARRAAISHDWNEILNHAADDGPKIQGGPVSEPEAKEMALLQAAARHEHCRSTLLSVLLAGSNGDGMPCGGIRNGLEPGELDVTQVNVDAVRRLEMALQRATVETRAENICDGVALQPLLERMDTVLKLRKAVLAGQEALKVKMGDADSSSAKVQALVLRDLPTILHRSGLTVNTPASADDGESGKLLESSDSAVAMRVLDEELAAVREYAEHRSAAAALREALRTGAASGRPHELVTATIEIAPLRLALAATFRLPARGVALEGLARLCDAVERLRAGLLAEDWETVRRALNRAWVSQDLLVSARGPTSLQGTSKLFRRQSISEDSKNEGKRLPRSFAFSDAIDSGEVEAELRLASATLAHHDTEQLLADAISSTDAELGTRGIAAAATRSMSCLQRALYAAMEEDSEGIKLSGGACSARATALLGIANALLPLRKGVVAAVSQINSSTGNDSAATQTAWSQVAAAAIGAGAKLAAVNAGFVADAEAQAAQLEVELSRSAAAERRLAWALCGALASTGGALLVQTTPRLLLTVRPLVPPPPPPVPGDATHGDRMATETESSAPPSLEAAVAAARRERVRSPAVLRLLRRATLLLRLRHSASKVVGDAEGSEEVVRLLAEAEAETEDESHTSGEPNVEQDDCAFDQVIISAGTAELALCRRYVRALALAEQLCTLLQEGALAGGRVLPAAAHASVPSLSNALEEARLLRQEQLMLPPVTGPRGSMPSETFSPHLQRLVSAAQAILPVREALTPADRGQGKKPDWTCVDELLRSIERAHRAGECSWLGEPHVIKEQTHDADQHQMKEPTFAGSYRVPHDPGTGHEYEALASVRYELYAVHKAANNALLVRGITEALAESEQNNGIGRAVVASADGRMRVRRRSLGGLSGEKKARPKKSLKRAATAVIAGLRLARNATATAEASGSSSDEGEQEDMAHEAAHARLGRRLSLLGALVPGGTGMISHPKDRVGADQIRADDDALRRSGGQPHSSHDTVAVRMWRAAQVVYDARAALRERQWAKLRRILSQAEVAGIGLEPDHGDAAHNTQSHDDDAESSTGLIAFKEEINHARAALADRDVLARLLRALEAMARTAERCDRASKERALALNGDNNTETTSKPVPDDTADSSLSNGNILNPLTSAEIDAATEAAMKLEAHEAELAAKAAEAELSEAARAVQILSLRTDALLQTHDVAQMVIRLRSAQSRLDWRVVEKSATDAARGAQAAAAQYVTALQQPQVVGEETGDTSLDDSAVAAAWDATMRVVACARNELASLRSRARLYDLERALACGSICAPTSDGTKVHAHTRAVDIQFETLADAVNHVATDLGLGLGFASIDDATNSTWAAVSEHEKLVRSAEFVCKLRRLLACAGRLEEEWSKKAKVAAQAEDDVAKSSAAETDDARRASEAAAAAAVAQTLISFEGDTGDKRIESGVPDHGAIDQGAIEQQPRGTNGIGVRVRGRAGSPQQARERQKQIWHKRHRSSLLLASQQFSTNAAERLAAATCDVRNVWSEVRQMLARCPSNALVLHGAREVQRASLELAERERWWAACDAIKPASDADSNFPTNVIKTNADFTAPSASVAGAKSETTLNLWAENNPNGGVHSKRVRYMQSILDLMERMKDARRTHRDNEQASTSSAGEDQDDFCDGDDWESGKHSIDTVWDAEKAENLLGPLIAGRCHRILDNLSRCLRHQRVARQLSNALRQLDYDPLHRACVAARRIVGGCGGAGNIVAAAAAATVAGHSTSTDEIGECQRDESTSLTQWLVSSAELLQCCRYAKQHDALQLRRLLCVCGLDPLRESTNVHDSEGKRECAVPVLSFTKALERFSVHVRLELSGLLAESFDEWLLELLKRMVAGDVDADGRLQDMSSLYLNRLLDNVSVLPDHFVAGLSRETTLLLTSARCLTCLRTAVARGDWSAVMIAVGVDEAKLASIRQQNGTVTHAEPPSLPSPLHKLAQYEVRFLQRSGVLLAHIAVLQRSLCAGISAVASLREAVVGATMFFEYEHEHEHDHDHEHTHEPGEALLQHLVHVGRDILDVREALQQDRAVQHMLARVFGQLRHLCALRGGTGPNADPEARHALDLVAHEEKVLGVDTGEMTDQHIEPDPIGVCANIIGEFYGVPRGGWRRPLPGLCKSLAQELLQVRILAAQQAAWRDARARLAEAQCALRVQRDGMSGQTPDRGNSQHEPHIEEALLASRAALQRVRELSVQDGGCVTPNLATLELAQTLESAAAPTSTTTGSVAQNGATDSADVVAGTVPIAEACAKVRNGPSATVTSMETLEGSEAMQHALEMQARLRRAQPLLLALRRSVSTADCNAMKEHLSALDCENTNEKGVLLCVSSQLQRQLRQLAAIPQQAQLEARLQIELSRMARDQRETRAPRAKKGIKKTAAIVSRLQRQLRALDLEAQLDADNMRGVVSPDFVFAACPVWRNGPGQPPVLSPPALVADGDSAAMDDWRWNQSQLLPITANVPLKAAAFAHRLHSNVLGVLGLWRGGTNACSFPASLVLDSVLIVQREPSLRDEALMQLLWCAEIEAQVLNAATGANTTADSVRGARRRWLLCWAMLRVALDSFGPTRDLEHWVERYIGLRHSGCTRALHRSLYPLPEEVDNFGEKIVLVPELQEIERRLTGIAQPQAEVGESALTDAQKTTHEIVSVKSLDDVNAVFWDSDSGSVSGVEDSGDDKDNEFIGTSMSTTVQKRMQRKARELEKRKRHIRRATLLNSAPFEKSLALGTSVTLESDPSEDVTTPVPAEAWEAVFDDEGSMYYFNTVTGETSWELPSPTPQHAQDGSGVAANGWEEAYDDDGNLYFYQPATGETAWELPQDPMGSDRDIGTEKAVGGYAMEQQHEQHVDEEGKSMVSGTPPQWTEHIDEHSGEAYYHNPTTGETSWVKPLSP